MPSGFECGRGAVSVATRGRVAGGSWWTAVEKWLAMGNKHFKSSGTMLERLVDSIRQAAQYDRNDLEPPAAVLWTDEAREWEVLVPRLREAMAELLALGAYDPATRTGPAIWMKCVLYDPNLAGGFTGVPVIYLPGVGRGQLRAIEACSPLLKPLCELQYRGVIWSAPGGRDWSVRGWMIAAEGGVGLDVAADAATVSALKQSLVQLASERVESLRGRRLDAGDFHNLLAPDPARSVLEWMNDPASFKGRGTGPWAAFRTVCRERFGVDPEKVDVTKAGQLLAEGQGGWSGVWARYEESPTLFPGVREVLKRSKPGGAMELFGSEQSRYPQDNESAEAALRGQLVAVGKMSEGAARAKLEELERAHGPRRGQVWAKLGECPLAAAMEQLAVLAILSATAIGGVKIDDAAALYVGDGWRVDVAAMAALACVKPGADLTAVGAAVAAVYGPWLQRSAEHFQGLVDAKSLPLARESAGVACEEGMCLVFADGLRMDLGQRVAAELGRRGAKVTLGWRWSTVPTVTATAKPAASPIADLLDRETVDDSFTPAIAESKKGLTADRFRTLLANRGIQPLRAGEMGDPTSRAWMEVGTIDHRGHSEGARLAGMLEDEVRQVADRVMELLSAGWGKVRVVTDHGWLLLPGGLPKVSLPRYLVETNWRRCASVREGSSPERQQHPWHWNPKVSIAVAPGISCFREGAEYAHGGLSVQECVTPVIDVAGAGDERSDVAVTAVRWTNLLGRVQVTGTSAVAVALRSEASDPDSSMLDEGTPSVPLDSSGKAKFYARDDTKSLVGEVVVLDQAGRVLARRPTTVGME